MCYDLKDTYKTNIKHDMVHASSMIGSEWKSYYLI